MRKFMAGLGIAATMLIAMPKMALAAANQDFALHNATGMNFTEVYIAPSESNSWGNPVFKDEVPDGATGNIHFTGYGDDVCKFSIRVTTEDGKSWDVDEIDLCETNKITFKLEGSKMKYYPE